MPDPESKPQDLAFKYTKSTATSPPSWSPHVPGPTQDDQRKYKGYRTQHPVSQAEVPWWLGEGRRLAWRGIWGKLSQGQHFSHQHRNNSRLRVRNTWGRFEDWYENLALRIWALCCFVFIKKQILVSSTIPICHLGMRYRCRHFDTPPTSRVWTFFVACGCCGFSS